MTDIKFIGTTQVELVNSLDESNKISPIQVGENFIEFSFNTLSKDSSDFYHFVITGSNVQVSGTIDSVTTDYQFFSLFSGCSQITDASQLQITAPTMKFFCFGNMFKDCTNLINPPSVEATTLADWCYQGMFAGCSKMTSAPQLPATTLAPYCYYAMFYGCSSLTSAPHLSASTLVDWCYNSMFFNCQSLTSISADFIDWNTSGNSTKNWVTGIETIGDFYNDNVDEVYGVDEIPQNWKPDYSNTPLTFKGKSANNAIKLTKSGIPDTINLSYSKNNGEWIAYTLNELISLNQNQTVAFSGDNINFSKDIVNYYNFAMTGTIKANGNIQSLMNYSYSVASGCYTFMFYGCSSLITPPVLPATTLAEGCYQSMFYKCTSLTAVPQLPATTLVKNCYHSMFFKCFSLSSIPSNYLPVTTLAEACYSQMFQECTSLTSAPSLPATTALKNCYREMFSDCSSLSTAPALPATGLADYCYFGMFNGCRSLSTAPQLPVTTLAEACYYMIFNGCSNLSSAPQLPATTLAPHCYRSMFQGCTSLSAAPALPATTLAEGCYYRMFFGCSNLSSINVSFTDWTQATNATTEWVYEVAANGTFYKPNELSAEYGPSRIPQNWTLVNK